MFSTVSSSSFYLVTKYSLCISVGITELFYFSLSILYNSCCNMHFIETYELTNIQATTSKATMLPYEIAEEVVQYLNADYPDILCRALNPNFTVAQICSLKKGRTNPLNYFRQLTNDPEKLMRVMFATRTCVSGSMASSFFYPSVKDTNSDWDFYCNWESYSVIVMSTYLAEIGVKWSESPAYSNSTKAQRYRCASIESVLSGTIDINGCTKKVQLVLTMRSVIETVLSFDLSICQCIVTAYCAISLYHYISSKSEFMCWVTKRPRPGPAATQLLERVNKYSSRGMKIISYETFFSKQYLQDYSMFNPLTHTAHTRQIKDKWSYVLPFYNRSLSYISNKEIEMILDRVKQFSWVEEPYTLLLCGQYQAHRWFLHKQMRELLTSLSIRDDKEVFKVLKASSSRSLVPQSILNSLEVLTEYDEYYPPRIEHDVALNAKMNLRKELYWLPRVTANIFIEQGVKCTSKFLI